MKKNILTAAFSLAFATVVAVNASRVESQQLRGYVSEVVAQLYFGVHENKDIKKLTKSIVSKVKEEHRLGWYYSYYNSDTVYRIVLQEVVEFVGKQAYAIKESKYVCKKIKKDLEKTIGKMREIPMGFLLDYYGTELAKKVSMIKEPRPKQIIEKLFPSTTCCICMEYFDGNIEQIYLSPCGHDICKVCCREYFFKYKKTECPHCRKKVDKKVLKELIFNR